MNEKHPHGQNVDTANEENAEAVKPTPEEPAADAQTPEQPEVAKEPDTVPPEEEKKDGLEWGPASDEALTKKLAEAEKKLADMEKMRLLALAEMDNQRKRFAKEMEALRYRTTQDTMFPFLQVFDHFTMAVKASSGDNVNPDTIRQGMKMIQGEFDKAFGELGVTLINAEGAVFDPKFHEAVAEEASDTVPHGTVIRQWSMGCRLGERLLKPAMVVVSSGPASETEKK